MSVLNRGSKKENIPTALYALSISYFVAGVILLAAMTQSKYVPFHLGLIGALNILVSYSMTRMRWWSTYVAALISLVNLVFGSVTLSAIISLLSMDTMNILILLGMIVYIALSLILLAYVALKRNRFM